MDPPLEMTELMFVFKNLKNGKAPGLDKIDYAIWKACLNTNNEFF